MPDTAHLEATVRRCWEGSTQSLTVARLARASGWSQGEVRHGMGALLRAGVVDLDVDAGGEVCWTLPGGRPVRATSLALSTPGSAPRPTLDLRGAGVRLRLDPDRKGLLVSGGVSLLFGPFGWLYAGPWLEAAVAIAVYLLVSLLVPRFLLGTFFGVVHPTCGVLGVLYAWKFNQAKRRTPVLFAGAPTSVSGC